VHRRRRLVALALLVALLAGGWLWLRDASFVRVREVVVTGLSSSEEPRIRAALRAAALDMTTLHVREDVLRDAVAAHPSVAGLEVDAEPPHRLRIEVRERRPVATLESGAQRVAATGAGLLLRDVRPPESLPRVPVRAVPPGERVTDRRALAALEVAAAAPAPLRTRVRRIGAGPRGLTLELRAGPALVFGSEGRARAKWAAAARVLAEPDAAGATYLDVRVPERVAAGGLAPLATPQPQVEGTILSP